MARLYVALTRATTRLTILAPTPPGPPLDRRARTVRASRLSSPGTVGTMADTPLALVRAFCDSWATGDLDKIMSFFADDAVYHNIPVEPIHGADAIRATIAGFTTGVESVVFEMKHIAAAGDIVMTERVDVFTFPNGRIALPVAGTFEVRDGKIVAWRDYFDMNQFVSQLPKS